MKIIWNTTGDILNLTPVNSELAEYWVNSLSTQGQNNLKFLQSSFNHSYLIDLKEHLEIINSVLSNKLKIIELEEVLEKDLLDQTTLNHIHRVWVKLHYKYPNIVTLIQKINQYNLFHWNQINKKLHFIEKNIDCTYGPLQPNWEIENKFGSNILSFNTSQVQISFSQKGRTTYNKWLNFDSNCQDIDTNDYLEIGCEVYINPSRPLLMPPPTNYIEYCKHNNIDVIGEYLNLANFTNYEQDLAKIRHVILRNIQHESNTISFEF
jgi:hypothetical protein